MRFTLCALVLCALLALASAADPTPSARCKFSAQIGSQTYTYDLTPLMKTGTKKEDNWVIHETSKDPNENQQRSYYYYLNFCAPVIDAMAFRHNEPGDVHIGAFQVTDDGNSTFAIGNATDAFATSILNKDVRYVFGKAQDGRQAVVALTCANDGLGSPQYFDEFSGVDGGYVFVWTSCAACPIGHPSRSACPNPTPATRAECASYLHELGKAVAIVAVLTLLTAFFVGILFKRLVKGAKGWEQIPLIDMWRIIFCCTGQHETYALHLTSDSDEQAQPYARPAGSGARHAFSEDEDPALMDA